MKHAFPHSSTSLAKQKPKNNAKHSWYSSVPTDTVEIHSCIALCPHRRYSYFDVVVGIVWSNDPKSYVGGSVATGRVSLAGQVKGDEPDKKGYPGPPGWGLGVRLTTSHRKIMVTTPKRSLGNGDDF
jgi:hypothetical protein